MTDPDQVLMRRLQNGDETAYEVLVHKYQGMVFALVRRYMGSRYADIDDVAQGVFLRLYRGRMTYKPKAKVKTWLFSITVNACLNEIRRLGTEKHKRIRNFTAVFGDSQEEGGGAALLPSRDTQVAGEDLESSELRLRIEAAVDALPDQQRLALVLTRFHGCSYEDTAETLSTTVSAVKSLLTRARERLRQSLAEVLEGSSAPHEAGGAAAPSPSIQKRAAGGNSPPRAGYQTP